MLPFRKSFNFCGVIIKSKCCHETVSRMTLYIDMRWGGRGNVFLNFLILQLCVSRDAVSLRSRDPTFPTNIGKRRKECFSDSQCRTAFFWLSNCSIILSISTCLSNMEVTIWSILYLNKQLDVFRFPFHIWWNFRTHFVMTHFLT